MSLHSRQPLSAAAITIIVVCSCHRLRPPTIANSDAPSHFLTKFTKSHALLPPKHLSSVPSAVLTPLSFVAFVPKPSHHVTRLPAVVTESLPLVCRHRRLSSTTHLSSTTKAVVASRLPAGRPPLASAFVASWPLLLPSLIPLRRPLSFAIAVSCLLSSTDVALSCGRLSSRTSGHRLSSDAGQATSCLCFHHILSTSVALSHLSSPPLVSSHLPPLPYLVADCHVLAPSGPRRALLDALAQGIGARGQFPPAAAMVVILVVIGRWRLGGAILWGIYFF